MAKIHLCRFGDDPNIWETHNKNFDSIKSHIGNYIGNTKRKIGEPGHPLSDRIMIIEIELSDNSDFKPGIYEYINL